MTKNNLFKTTAACLLSVGAMVFTTSCQPTSPESYSTKLTNSQNVTVHGYNGRETVSSRNFIDHGAMPANARRAMTKYIKSGEWQYVDYICPQYFIQVDNAYWAVCIDSAGNMVGILPFHGDEDARYMPNSDHYKILVNKTDDAPALAYAILSNLAYADGLRVQTRAHDGLDTPKPVKPEAKNATPANPATPAKPAEKTDSDDTDDEEPADDASDSSDEEEPKTDDSSDSSSSDDDLFGDDDF